MSDQGALTARLLQSHPYKQFGAYLVMQRRKLGGSLRAFCDRTGRTYVLTSWMECGVLPPPADKTELEALAHDYGLRDGTQEQVEFWNFVEGALRISRGEFQGMELSE